MNKILKLDVTGQPDDWISTNAAIIYHAKNMVAWQLGEGEGDVLYRGGENRITGMQSRIITAPIIAVKGEKGSAIRASKKVSLTNLHLFERDQYLCAYCGGCFREDDLTRDHIIPKSRGGPDRWMNVVSACGACNNKKDYWLLQECGMELLYVPYEPNHAEKLLLENRHVLFCQMEYLQAFLPSHSRVWDALKEH